MVNRILALVVLAALTLTTNDAMAQTDAEGAEAAAATVDYGLGKMGLGIGTGLVLLGAGLGIGRIGGQAVEAMSRQPEASGTIQTGMLISAALIEGAAFFSLILILIGLFV